MLSDKELEAVLEVLQSRFDDINSAYIRKVAEQIKRIGELGQANINRLLFMAELTSDVREITRMLETASGLTETDIQALYDRAMQDTYTDPRFSRAFKSGAKLPHGTTAQLTQYARNVARQTAKTVQNLSNTTAVYAPYREAVDRGILAVSTGLTDYNMATREIVRRIGYNGLQVQYASGYHRRLDTAVRQNVIDGVKQIAQHGANAIGEALDYQQVEISAHANSAPDHEPVQGRIFTKSEFEKLQTGQPFCDVTGRQFAGIKRPIAEWNCGHFALPFDSRYAKPRFSDKQLQDWARSNRNGCDLDGKHYSLYQVQQLMRQIETQVRRQKDTANAARITGDDVLRRECQVKINALAAKYEQISAISGLPMRKQRMSVEGFKMVKV